MLAGILLIMTFLSVSYDLILYRKENGRIIEKILRIVLRVSNFSSHIKFYYNFPSPLPPNFLNILRINSFLWICITCLMNEKYYMNIFYRWCLMNYSLFVRLVENMNICMTLDFLFYTWWITKLYRVVLDWCTLRSPDAQKPGCPDAQKPRCPEAQEPRCPDAKM